MARRRERRIQKMELKVQVCFTSRYHSPRESKKGIERDIRNKLGDSVVFANPKNGIESGCTIVNIPFDSVRIQKMELEGKLVS